MTRTITAPLMGAYFRPPAKAVLSLLPSGIVLGLEPEPENPHDPDAIKVWVDPQTWRPDEETVDALDVHCQGYGLDVNDVLRQPIWLGYVARTRPEKGVPVGNAEFLRAMASVPGYTATLGFSPEGKPQVILTTGD